MEASDLKAKGYRADPGTGSFTKQGTPDDVVQERNLANRESGPRIGAEVSVSVVTPQGTTETVNLPAIDHRAIRAKSFTDSECLPSWKIENCPHRIGFRFKSYNI